MASCRDAVRDVSQECGANCVFTKFTFSAIPDVQYLASWLSSGSRLDLVCGTTDLLGKTDTIVCVKQDGFAFQATFSLSLETLRHYR
jgi:hypothetical protein